MALLYTQFGAYLALMLGIGYVSMRRTKTNEDFIIGGRTIGPVTSAISAGVSVSDSTQRRLCRVSPAPTATVSVSFSP